MQTPTDIRRTEILKPDKDDPLSYKVVLFCATFDCFEKRRDSAHSIITNLGNCDFIRNLAISRESKDVERHKEVINVLTEKLAAVQECETDQDLELILKAFDTKIQELADASETEKAGKAKKAKKVEKALQRYACQNFTEENYMNAYRVIVWDPEGERREKYREKERAKEGDKSKEKLEEADARADELYKKDLASKDCKLSHRTWLIQKDKAEEFWASLKEKKGQVVPYSMFGDKSVFNYHNLLDNETMYIKLPIFSILSGIILECSGLRPIYDSFLKPIAPGWKILGSTVAGLSLVATYTFIYDEYVKGKPMPHNCATWSIEQLHTLNDPKIEAGLNPKGCLQLVDRLAHVTSFHLGTDEEAVGFVTKTLPKITAVFSGPPALSVAGSAYGVLKAADHSNIEAEGAIIAPSAVASATTALTYSVPSAKISFGSALLSKICYTVIDCIRDTIRLS
ncbi:MAG: hypothetical protein K0R73_1478 [Candidatus Midichloriaceae bacterium]|jgi:hypothetical protein|nr:hypothetical protein [Candidatus Midichloriaceae bacterium]